MAHRAYKRSQKYLETLLREKRVPRHNKIVGELSHQPQKLQKMCTGTRPEESYIFCEIFIWDFGIFCQKEVCVCACVCLCVRACMRARATGNGRYSTPLIHGYFLYLLCSREPNFHPVTQQLWLPILKLPLFHLNSENYGKTTTWIPDVARTTTG